jgi:hypothetical protein
MVSSVTKAKYIRDYLMEVKFNDGTKKVIDFEPWLTGPIFKPLKNKQYFKKFFIDGPTTAWSNGALISRLKRYTRQLRSTQTPARKPGAPFR